MALTPKGKKILRRMEMSYSKQKAKEVFTAMIEEGKLTGVEKKATRKRRKASK